MVLNWRQRWRRFWTVWGLYGAIASGGICTLMVAVAAFIEYGFYSEGGFTFDTALFLLVVLPIVWLVVGLLAILPSVSVGLIHWVISHWINSVNILRVLTCAIAAIFSLPYGLLAASVQYDGIPMLWLPVSMILGAVVCFATLRVRDNVYRQFTQESRVKN